MPLEICDKVLDTIKSDGAISSYTGYSVNDSRIYSWNPMFNITFSPTQKAAILFRYAQSPDPMEKSYPTQRGDVYFYFQIKSPDRTLAARIGERIENMFRDKPLQSDNYKALVVFPNGNNDGDAEGTVTRPVYVRNVNLIFKQIFKLNQWSE